MTVQMLEPEAADDGELVARLTDLINAVYATAVRLRDPPQAAHDVFAAPLSMSWAKRSEKPAMNASPRM
jgi:hypothetical protein